MSSRRTEVRWTNIRTGQISLKKSFYNNKGTQRNSYMHTYENTSEKLSFKEIFRLQPLGRLSKASYVPTVER